VRIVPDLRRDEELLPRHAAVHDSGADTALVLVERGRVDAAVSGFDRLFDGPLALVVGDLEDTESQLGDPLAVVQLDVWNVHTRHVRRPSP